MRSCHGSTAFETIISSRQCGQHVDSRRTQMDCGRAEVGERSSGISIIRSGHGDYIGSAIVGGIKGIDVIITIVISRSSDKQHVVAVGTINFVKKRLGKAS